MAWQLVTPPAEEPVSLSDAVEHLRVVGDADQAYVQGLITKARLWVEGVLDRQLVTATWKLFVDGFPKRSVDVIEIKKAPVQSIEAVRYADAAGDEQTWSSDEYQADLVSEPARLRPLWGYTWPTTRSRQLHAVEIELVAGYGDAADVPATLKHAILLLVGHWFSHHEPVLTGTIITPVPFTVQSLLALEDWGGYP
ncbi:MAG: hypothetical protein RBS77_06670 [Candidatus Moranbacteria bacterium]|jgi:uncharacterized phiE125 gp8 family phage protein|nr:hypothetical protein [Candidatus Moranbacteria bacterium]